MASVILGTSSSLTAAARSPLPVVPYAIYCLASDLVAGTSVAVGADLMGGTSLTKVGNPTDHGYYATTDGSNYWKTPFIGDTLVNAGGSQTGCTVLGVGRAAAGASHTFASTYEISTFVIPCMDLSLSSTKLTSVLMQANARLATIANDATRGSRFAMYGGIYMPTYTSAIERHSGATSSTVVTTAFASQTIGSGGPFYIGHRTDLSGDGSDLSLVAFFQGALTQAQIDSCYPYLKDMIASAGL